MDSANALNARGKSIAGRKARWTTTLFVTILLSTAGSAETTAPLTLFSANGNPPVGSTVAELSFSKVRVLLFWNTRKFENLPKIGEQFRSSPDWTNRRLPRLPRPLFLIPLPPMIYSLLEIPSLSLIATVYHLSAAASRHSWILLMLR